MCWDRIFMSAETEVKRRIQEKGKITFEEFMSIALYWPQGGYYAGREPVGAVGDYYTSPAVHPAFGALLAVQLYQMWQIMERPSVFTVLELGAGNGLLSRDITGYASHLPGSFARTLRYVCLDRRQVTRLEDSNRVLADAIPIRGLEGCVLSNEYLDAFAVHQVVMDSGVLKEVHVALEDGNLAQVLDEPADAALARRLDFLGITLTEGQTAEINLGLEKWAGDLSGALEHGFTLTVDYGRTAPDLYNPELRRRGTLVTYHQHVQTDAPLRRIGEQDITAQVDFTSAMRLGEDAGLSTLGLVKQSEFLANMGLGHFQRHTRGQDLPPRHMRANLAGLVDLVRPGGLGDFKVLAHGKNVGLPDLWGLEQSTESQRLVESLPAPLLTPEHLWLDQGNPFGGEVEFEAFWPESGPENPGGTEGQPD